MPRIFDRHIMQRPARPLAWGQRKIDGRDCWPPATQTCENLFGNPLPWLAALQRRVNAVASLNSASKA